MLKKILQNDFLFIIYFNKFKIFEFKYFKICELKIK